MPPARCSTARNDHLRANAKMNSYALKAWCWQVLATARERSLKATYECGTGARWSEETDAGRDEDDDGEKPKDCAEESHHGDALNHQRAARPR